MRALITTTINTPVNLRDWAKSGFAKDDVFIVAGDKRTPEKAVRELLTTLPVKTVYLAPSDQAEWLISDITGWNSIQRRNVALLEAMALNPEWIITVDDDNYPTHHNHVSMVDALFSKSEIHPKDTPGRYTTIHSASGWYNVCRRLQPPCVHRGYPVSQREDQNPSILTPETRHRIGVVASLWLGDPDIDAVQRMTDHYFIRGMEPGSVVLGAGTWCPFNSQATAFRAELAPLMAVWPFVGRYDDIFASFLARAVMDAGEARVWYGEPLVRQDRNKHNLINDLKNEMLGLEFTEVLCTALRGIANPTLKSCIDVIKTLTFMPDGLSIFFDAWQSDVLLAQRRAYEVGSETII